MTDAEKKAAKLAAQWPKICGCGRSYSPTDHGPASNAVLNLAPWSSLEFAYARADDFARAEARHCVCGSTLEIMIEILDLEAE